MGEKRGNTGKLKFDFDPLDLLEIQFNDHDKWYRVTAEYFRSFDGKRRITYPTEVLRRIAQVEMKTEEFEGNLYYWGTNNIAPKLGTGKTVSSPNLERILEASKKQYQG